MGDPLSTQIPHLARNHCRIHMLSYKALLDSRVDNGHASRGDHVSRDLLVEKDKKDCWIDFFFLLFDTLLGWLFKYLCHKHVEKILLLCCFGWFVAHTFFPSYVALGTW